ncbi:hypothetical protein [Sorangium sp. So ce1153]|uniref:hypothetical protein n=1 Tax=Sorangium sp. So ce1153 TaxID=3133333 RepID=UPI003F63BF31
MDNEEEHEYFTCRVTVDGEELYCIWYTNGSDGVVAQEGKIMFWRSEEMARSHAMREGLRLASEPGASAAFDMDLVLCQKDDPCSFCSKDVLDMWNLLDDMGKSLNCSEFVRCSEDVSELHARLSSTVLSHVLGSRPEQFTVGDVSSIVRLLCVGKAMIRERCMVIG